MHKCSVYYVLSCSPVCTVLSMLKMVKATYSKTSNNGHSEKRTTSLQRTAHLPLIDFTIELIHYEPPRSGHLSTPNNGHKSGPDVPWPKLPPITDSEATPT